MRLKQYTNYHVNFNSKCTAACGALMGLSFFLRIVYYFGLMSLRDVGFFELLTSAFFGIILCGGVVVCLICMRMDAPGLYGLAGAAQCLFLIILSFTTGSAGRIILALVWYSLTAVILLVTVGGYLPGRLLAGLMFFVSAFIRFFFFDVGRIGVLQWFRELAVLSVLIGMGCFVMGLKSTTNRK